MHGLHLRRPRRPRRTPGSPWRGAFGQRSDRATPHVEVGRQRRARRRGGGEAAQQGRSLPIVEQVERVAGQDRRVERLDLPGVQVGVDEAGLRAVLLQAALRGA